MSPVLTVYAGSSLIREDFDRLAARAAASGVELRFRPPIVRGDLLRTPPAADWQERVLILDGHFGQDMAVSVAEVRAYLDRGAYLAGASSMGALRAAECYPLGMVSHGWVAQQYRSGRIDADSDVALLMAPSTSEALTIPLVNVRWLLLQLSGEGLETALEIAAGLHYRNRLPQILAARLEEGLPPKTASMLTGYLEPQAIPGWDRKRLDGVEAVESEIRALSAGLAGAS
ncbi:TfuA-like protein [Kineosporia sp. NBRC 101731]|uniref:TfuA-like protein n=1 Tax=Kineosporia sp. NBRC 101731 TaxID=3032199 RepID=UPI0024A44FF0|nr:TfuA-like protein [Kineosporia sp. NBRC 101731]GLY33854.1 antibiotic resistance protein [Kineosporia sp. NBRC 101731]